LFLAGRCGVPQYFKVTTAILQSENLAEAGDENPDAEGIFWRLCAAADSYGTVRCDSLRRLKNQIAGLRTSFTAADLAAILDCLERNKLIVRYGLNGSEYLHIPNYVRYQNPRWARTGRPSFPPPPDWTPPEDLLEYLRNRKDEDLAGYYIERDGEKYRRITPGVVQHPHNHGTSALSDTPKTTAPAGVVQDNSPSVEV